MLVFVNLLVLIFILTGTYISFYEGASIDTDRYIGFYESASVCVYSCAYVCANANFDDGSMFGMSPEMPSFW